MPGEEVDRKGVILRIVGDSCIDKHQFQQYVAVIEIISQYHTGGDFHEQGHRH